jgi:membrane-bound lytic murein transglycosylase D
VESELDPGTFYALRKDFDKIIKLSSRQARLYKPRRTTSPTMDGFVGKGIYRELDVPFPLPERILKELERFQDSNIHHKQLQLSLDRCGLYLPYIEAALDKAGMPRELAWIVAVESAFTPKINSRSGAGGMWQFMRGTGRQYGLRIDDWVDERYNWQSATHSAIAYLQFLYESFDGDWALALSAYNMGPGAMERAIASNGGTRDLWHLLETPPASNRIRLETKQYYPKCIASSIIAKDPERYGFTRPKRDALDIERVAVRGSYLLEDIDAALGYSAGTLSKLNPDLLYDMTPPTGEYSIAVPKAARTKFAAALKKTPKLKYGTGTHKVRPGQTISHIAQIYGVSQRDLMRLNSVKSARSLRANQVLRIPGYEKRPGVSGTTMTASSSGTYRVKRNDTLWDIANAHGISVADLQRWNNVSSSRLKIGTALNVSSPTSTSSSPNDLQFHVVKAGEYPAKIARNYGMTTDSFLRLNSLKSTSTIRVGEKLKVAVKATGATTSAPRSPATNTTTVQTAPSPETKTITYAVASGDTAGGIAQRHGVKTSQLLAWNNLKKSSILRIGQKLTIHPAEEAVTAPIQVASAAGGGTDETTYNDIQKMVHIVRKGQNPWTIARSAEVKVQDLFKWNKWPEKHVLQIGDEVIIYK